MWGRLKTQCHSFFQRCDSAHLVGQPILAAAGFQPALAGCEDSRTARKSRLKGGCGHDCPPHNQFRMTGIGKNKWHWVVQSPLIPAQALSSIGPPWTRLAVA